MSTGLSPAFDSLCVVAGPQSNMMWSPPTFTTYEEPNRSGDGTGVPAPKYV